MNTETENQIRLRRAKQALEACRTAENEARKLLASSIESTKRAKLKYEELFVLEEQREKSARTNAYHHATA